MGAVLFALVAALTLYVLSGLRQINQWETALRFTLGKLPRARAARG